MPNQIKKGRVLEQREITVPPQSKKNIMIPPISKLADGQKTATTKIIPTVILRTITEICQN